MRELRADSPEGSIRRLDVVRDPATLTRGGTAIEERDDDELMLLARGGQAGAFDVLVRRYQGLLLAVARKHLGDADIAKDVAQDTLVKLHRYIPTYEPRGRLKALIFRICLNECRQRWRRRKTERKGSTLLRADAGGQPDADEAILMRQRRLRVERALQKLSPKLRAVLILRVAAELSHDEIGEALNLPVGTVKSRLSAAVTKLRRHALRGLHD